MTAGLADSNGSLQSGLWLTSPAGWLPRTGISSGTLCSAVEYGLPNYLYLLLFCQDKLSTILDILTPDDIRLLIETVDEYHRRGNFQRIFPSSQSYKYLAFCEQPRYYNLLLDAWVRRYPGSNPEGTVHICSERLSLAYHRMFIVFGLVSHVSPDFSCVLFM